MPKSRFTSAQWDQIKMAYIAGAPPKDLLALFPGLSYDSLRQAACRGNWPTPSRILQSARKRASVDLCAIESPSSEESSNTPQNQATEPHVTVTDLSRQSLSQTATPSASDIGIAVLNGARNQAMGSFSAFAKRALPVLDRWTPLDPKCMKDGLALVELIRRTLLLDQAQTQVNVSIGPHVRTNDGHVYDGETGEKIS